MNYHKIAEEIYERSYCGGDKNFRISKIQEIEDWLYDNYEDGVTVNQLYSKWEEYECCEYDDEDYRRDKNEYESY